MRSWTACPLRTVSAKERYHFQYSLVLWKDDQASQTFPLRMTFIPVLQSAFFCYKYLMCLGAPCTLSIYHSMSIWINFKLALIYQELTFFDCHLELVSFLKYLVHLIRCQWHWFILLPASPSQLLFFVMPESHQPIHQSYLRLLRNFGKSSDTNCLCHSHPYQSNSNLKTRSVAW